MAAYFMRWSRWALCRSTRRVAFSFVHVLKVMALFAAMTLVGSVTWAGAACASDQRTLAPICIISRLTYTVSGNFDGRGG
jgi:hypothetical protein